VNGATISVHGVGACTVTASQAGNADWLAAPNVSQSFQVTPAPTTTVLGTDAQGDVDFGDAVTLSAAVTANPPSVATPTGTVSFAKGADALATDVPLENGVASVNAGVLRPGDHTFTATYSPTANFLGSSGEAAVSVTCRTTITKTVPGSLVVKRSTCLQPGAKVVGNVTVKPGGALASDGARIVGSVTATEARALLICSSRVVGNTKVKDTLGFTVIGESDESGGCGGNALVGPVDLYGNSTVLELARNRVTGWVSVRETEAGDAPIRVVVSDNDIVGALRCSGNSPAPTNAGSSNTVRGLRGGQCRDPEF
jgi:hypothetical protein